MHSLPGFRLSLKCLSRQSAFTLGSPLVVIGELGNLPSVDCLLWQAAAFSPYFFRLSPPPRNVGSGRLIFIQFCQVLSAWSPRGLHILTGWGSGESGDLPCGQDNKAFPQPLDITPVCFYIKIVSSALFPIRSHVSKGPLLLF